MLIADILLSKPDNKNKECHQSERSLLPQGVYILVLWIRCGEAVYHTLVN
ncbi:hypothetical protein ACPV4X_14600 [Vibrio owensii]